MTDRHRAAHRAAREEAAGLDGDRAFDRRVDRLAAHIAFERAEDQAVGLEYVFELAGVLPPARHDVRLDLQAAVDHVLDGVGDLKLATRRGPNCLDAREDLRREEVDAD